MRPGELPPPTSRLRLLRRGPGDLPRRRDQPRRRPAAQEPGTTPGLAPAGHKWESVGATGLAVSPAAVRRAAEQTERPAPLGRAQRCARRLAGAAERADSSAEP